jgi:hypothetical protein
VCRKQAAFVQFSAHILQPWTKFFPADLPTDRRMFAEHAPADSRQTPQGRGNRQDFTF